MPAPAVRLPPRLRRGDRIAALALSSPFPQDSFDAGLAVLRSWGLEPVPLVHPPAAPLGYLAGSDEQRAGALDVMLRDPGIAGIYCARGGYGITRMLHLVDWRPLRERPCAIAGFSDVTALHLAALCHAGVGGLHTPLLTSLTAGTERAREEAAVAAAREDTRRLLLEGEAPVLRADAAGMRRSGTGGWDVVDGPLLVANLSKLTALVGTPDMPALEGWILLLEDVNERPYRVDRMLTQLLRAGTLAGVVGVAAGDFSAPRAATGPEPSAEDVFVERLAPLGIPLATGFSVGHIARNEPAIIGARYSFDARDGTISPLQSLE